MRGLSIALICLALTGPALAQDRLEGGAVFALAEAAHLGGEAVADRVADIAPGLSDLDPRAPDSADPMLWVFTAAFGAPGPDRPAGLIHCARYGLDTRDRLAAHAASDPVVFPLVAALRPGTDDAALWPADAIAVMRCSFSWDDARRLTPWTEAEARVAIGPGFASLDRTDDATLRAEAGDHIRPQYGPGGFRLEARDRARDGHVWLERATAIRQLSHQRVSFRVYLLGGSV